jgi:hypothetical protein
VQEIQVGSTTFSGPLRLGTIREGADANLGYAVLSQSQILGFDATLVQNAIFKLPANAQILDIISDTLTAYDSATSATLTVGSAAAGTQYASGVNAKTAGRQRPTFSNAQLAAMDDIGASTDVYATVTSVGQPTAGSLRITVLYAQI